MEQAEDAGPDIVDTVDDVIAAESHDDVFAISAGLGYRVAANDFLALNVDVRDIMFESDLLGTTETLHNIQVSAGATVFF